MIRKLNNTFRKDIEKLIIEKIKKVTKKDFNSLLNLQEQIGDEWFSLDEANQTKIGSELYFLDEENQTYHKLLNDISEQLDMDFYFQKTVTIRAHPYYHNSTYWYHLDTNTFNQHPEQYNVFIPITTEDVGFSLVSSWFTKLSLILTNNDIKKLDKRKSLGKTLSKTKYIIDADPVKDYQLPDWVMNCAKQNEVKLDQKAAILIAEFLGNDLAAVDKNIQKLKLLVSSNQMVNIEMVQKHIGFSKDFNLFELTDALAAMNVQKASFIAQHFGKNNKNHPIVVTIGHLYGFFTKLMKYHFYERKLSEDNLNQYFKIGFKVFPSLLGFSFIENNFGSEGP